MAVLGFWRGEEISSQPVRTRMCDATECRWSTLKLKVRRITLSIKEQQRASCPERKAQPSQTTADAGLSKDWSCLWLRHEEHSIHLSCCASSPA